MSAYTITETDELVETMTNLVTQGVANLTEFATLTPALYAESPWKETDENGKTTKIADYFRETFGIGAARDGYVSLPTIALDAMSQAFADAKIKPSLGDQVAMSGASRATVARSRARVGLSDDQPQKSPNKGNSDNTGESGESGGEVSGETQEFDLAALLSALDDNELTAVLSTVGLDRVRKLVAA
jgi:hypothetical protein